MLPRINYQVNQIYRLIYEILLGASSFSANDGIKTIRNSNAEPINRSPTNNFGGTLRSGFLALDSRSTHVITLDSEDSHKPERINDLYSIAKNCNIRIVRRPIKNRTTDNIAFLRFVSRFLNMIYSFDIKIDFMSIPTYFKIYQSTDLKKVKLRCNYFEIAEKNLNKTHLLHNRKTQKIEIPDHYYQYNLGSTRRKLNPFIINYTFTLSRLRFRVK